MADNNITKHVEVFLFHWNKATVGMPRLRSANTLSFSLISCSKYSIDETCPYIWKVPDILGVQ